MRVAVVFDNLGPYHMARLGGAAGSMDMLAVEVAATSREYGWKASDVPDDVQRVRLLDDATGRSDWRLLSAAYVDRVAQWKPDAIALPGWSSPAALVGARWAAGCGRPAIVMSETNASDFPRHVTAELVKRRVVALFQAGLCGGTLAKSYLAELGFPQDRIFTGYDVVDNAYFSISSSKAREAGGLPASIDPAWRGRYFLASARFVPKKNLPFLLEAFARYRRATGASAWPLVLLGDGPMRGELENRRGALGLETLVVMPGFTHYDELPLYYGNAGVFIHASTTEQWGLVVNEAMASGLPVLVSERCGCAPDLVASGRNGHTFDPHDAGGLAGLMSELASEGYDRAAAGKASQAIIAGWSPQTFAEGLRRAASAALEAPRRRANALDKSLLWALSHR